MTPKERMIRALTHQPLDRLPTQINYTAAMGALMADYFGVKQAELPQFFDNHLVRVDIA